jgi:hypothetical protein
MIRAIGGLALICSLGALLAGCSSDAGDGHQSVAGTSTMGGASDADAGQGGSTGGKAGEASGGSESGGSKSGAAADGGQAGSAGSSGSSAGGSGGSSPAAQHCSPGKLIALADPKAPVTQCPRYDPDLIRQPKGTPLFVYDVKLDEVPKGGGTTALSAEFSSGQHPKLQLWTADFECGIATQQMDEAAAGPGIACQERTGATPSQHLLLVLFEDAPLEQVTACANGSCQ